MKIKRLALALSLLLGGALTACNNNPENTEGTTTVTTTAGEDTTSGVATITTWGSDLLALLATQFPGVTLPVAPVTNEYVWDWFDDEEVLEIYDECGNVTSAYRSILSAAGFTYDAEYSELATEVDPDGDIWYCYFVDKGSYDFCVDFCYFTENDALLIWVYAY